MQKHVCVLCYIFVILLNLSITFQVEGQNEKHTTKRDLRNIRFGHVIPDEGYCDQPYVIITKDGNWLCTLTTGKGKEGDPGQHVVATISKDKGKNWSELIDIEPASGPEASWVVPLITPYGRVYAFYDYNGDRITGRRADMLGWYVYKYSDDHGRTWSKERYRLPVRHTACDVDNGLEGDVQIFWGIDKPMIHDNVVYFAFTKLGRYMLEQGEGWLFRSENILTERNPEKIDWRMLPDGQHGIRNPKFGSVQEEHNIVALDDGTLYCMYRTTTGHPCQSYSFDDGHSWTKPEHATYTPGGRKFKHNRACPAIWKTQNGKYLFWFNNHAGKTYQKRNPVWISGGVEKNGRIHWSQPEILLYDPDKDVRISYPDIIEENGKYWISETQKSIARIHEIDASLFKGLWNQETNKEITKKGLCLELQENEIQSRHPMPYSPNLSAGESISIELWFKLNKQEPGLSLFDSTNQEGIGIRLYTTENQSMGLVMNDGDATFQCESDKQSIKAGRWHHLVVNIDSGPKIVSFIIDGVLCDGGTERERGWARFPQSMDSLAGADFFKVLTPEHGRIKTLRLYNRYLRTSEAIGNYHANFSKN